MLTMLVYQALVAKLCPHCALSSEEAKSSSEDIDAMLKVIKSLGLNQENFRWKRPGGCAHCNHRGTKGQTVVAEMLMPNEDWLAEIRSGRDDRAVAVYRSLSDGILTSDNMTGKTVFEHTLLKAYHGICDARQCNRFDNAERFAANFLKTRQAPRRLSAA